MLAMTTPGLRFTALEKGGAGCDVRRSADNGVVGHYAKRREKGVHRSAHALIEAVLPTRRFRRVSRTACSQSPNLWRRRP